MDQAMDNNEDSGSEITYTLLENVYRDSSFQFEDILSEGRSDDESDIEDEDYMPSDQDDGEDEVSSTVELCDNIDSSLLNECTFSSEETAVIQSCENQEIRRLLILNRSKHFMLMQLFIKIRDQLLECRKNIEGISILSKEHEKPVVQFLTHLAAPYFKTKKEMFSSLPNDDTLVKKRSGELSIYQNCMSAKWSQNQGDNLISAVKLTYNHNKQKEILKKISSLRFKLVREKGDPNAALQIITQIDKLEEELNDLKEMGMDDIPPLGKDDFIDWNHIASDYLKDKHSALECRSFWNIYLHPSINKSNWTAEENMNIKRLAEKYKAQDWDRIALELGTKRSGFSVFLHFQTALSEQFCKERFTQQEDNLILELVAKLKIGSYIPWSAIESHFKNRSRNQLVHRYKYYLSNKDHEMGSFSDAEDILLLILVERYGKNYSKFWHLIPNRSYMQVKNRYDLQLQTFSATGRFSLEEDQMLMNYMANSKGVKYIGALARQMNRKRCQLRQRYNTLKAFFDKNPKATLNEAPRRALPHNTQANKRLEFLKYIVEQFKDQTDVPTIAEVEERLGCKSKNNRRNDEYSDVDSLLVNFFSNSYKLRRQNTIDTTSHKIHEAAESISHILSRWKVNLKIPDELKKNNHLDIVDIEILNSLRERQKYSEIDKTSVEDLIPPNINTIIGLRSLLLKNQLYKRTKNRPKLGLMDNIPLIRNRYDNQLTTDLINMQRGINSNIMSKVENERCLFSKRFISLFMWPAIFSIEPPRKQLLDAEFGNKNVIVDENQQKASKRKKKKSTPSTRKYEPKIKRKKLCTETGVTECFEQNATRVSQRPKRRSTRLKGTTAESENTNEINEESELECEENLENEEIAKPTIMKSDPTPHLIESRKKDALTKPAKIISVIKVENKTVEEARNTDFNQFSELPSNLRKVDKSEVENMLKNKKPIKMFLIQKIKMKDGTVKTVTKPYLAPKPSGQNEITKEKLTKVNILDVVSRVCSVKKENEILNSENKDQSNSEKSESNNFMNVDQVLKNNIKHYSDRISSKFSSHRDSSNQNRSSIEKDLYKLDEFLSNYNNESVVDLTEEDIMKNEVKLLDNFIKSESSC